MPRDGQRGEYRRTRRARGCTLLARDSGRQTATPPSCGRLVLSALVLAAERIAASGPGRRILPPGAALESRASDVPRLLQGPRRGPPELGP